MATSLVDAAMKCPACRDCMVNIQHCTRTVRHLTQQMHRKPWS